MRIPDNYDLWKQHDREQHKLLQQLPRCSECDEPIQEEYCFEFNGEYICESCLKDNHKISVENLIC